MVSLRDDLKKPSGRRLCPHAQPRSKCRPCATARMRQWRKKNPIAAREADQRRTDERRLLEMRARTYVSAYLRRGRIVPPPFCDRCGRRAAVSFYHPDPLERRVLLWLCADDRRAVA